MKNKIVGIFVCMLMIATAIPVVGTANVQALNTLTSGIIGIKIVAKVNEVSDPYNLLGGVIKVNDSITGKYVYDSGIPDMFPSSPSYGEYHFPSSSCGIEVKAGGFVFQTNPNTIDFFIEIFNDNNDTDGFHAFSRSNVQLSNGMEVGLIELHLEDKNGTALDSDALPTTAPVLTEWKFKHYLQIQGRNPASPTQYYTIKAQIIKATKPKAIDVYGAESETSLMTIPYQEHLLFMQFWIRLVERFPNAFPILRNLME
jgi:hypothetical protein